MDGLPVTGGVGFIGSNFVRVVPSRLPEAQVVTLDALTSAGSLDNLTDLRDPSRHTFAHDDICDPALVAELLRQPPIDTIVNLAPETRLDRSVRGSARFIWNPLQVPLVIRNSLRSSLS